MAEEPKPETVVAPVTEKSSEQQLIEALTQLANVYIAHEAKNFEIKLQNESESQRMAAEVDKQTLRTLEKVDSVDKIFRGVMIVASLLALVIIAMYKTVDNGVIAILSGIITASIVSNSNNLLSLFIKKQSNSGGEEGGN